jgi:hypothetical protein
VDQRNFGIAALLIVIGAAVLRFWGLDGGLPHLMTRPDEEIIVLQTRLPAMGNFYLEWPGQHPGIPSAYIYLLWAWGEIGLRVLQFFGEAPAGDYLTLLNQAPDRILLTERFFSACAGTATVAVLMWAARREFGNRVALLAGLILATSVFHVRDSHSAKPDVALGLFVILSLGLLAPLARDLSRRGVCLAGLSIGMAMAMKPPGILLLLPGWIACIQGSRQIGWRRIFPFEIFLLTGIAGLFFISTSPDFIFNPETADKLLAIPGFVLPMLSGTGSSGAVGTESKVLMWPGLFYHYEFSLRYALGWPLMVLSPIALLWGIFSSRKMAQLSAWFFLFAYLVFGTSPVLLSRYMTPLLPVVALLLGAMVVLGVDGLIRAQAIPRSMVLILITAVLLWEPLVASVRFDRLMSVTDTRVEATRWLAKHTKKGDRVAFEGDVFWSWGNPQIPRGRPIVSLDPGGPEAAPTLADYLVVHDYPLFSSSADWEAIGSLGNSVRLVAEFDPFLENAEEAIFEKDDAFYVPSRGYEVVRAPGPLIRIYAVATREPQTGPIE